MLRLSLRALLLLMAVTADAAVPSSTTLPELPREYVNTGLQRPSGRSIHVPAGGDLQSALNAARLGDTITLQAGATYTGPFVLPRKEGSDWLVIRTNTPDSKFDRESVQRVGPSQAPLMARLIAPRGAVLTLAPEAHHYYVVGLELSPAPGTFLYSLVGPAVEARSDAEQFHHVVLDRCYLHGDPVRGSRRGVVLNGRHVAVIHSYLSDFKEVGADSQALSGWNGSGPFKIVDNYLEGAGENLMFGGADPGIRDLVPSDIEIRGNVFAKHPRWNPKAPQYDGSQWTIKALLELKNARRVLIEGNVLEETWDNAFLFTPRNQGGTAPWSTVADITVRYNWIRRVYSVLRILGSDNERPSQATGPILLEDNVAESLYDAGPPNPKMIVLLGSPDHVTIRHNTILTTPGQGSSFLVLAGGRANPGSVFTFRDNIIDVGTYGVLGEAPPLGRTGATFLDGHFQTWTFTGNVLVGSDRVAKNTYPSGQAWAPSLDAIGFVGLRDGNLKLGSTSPYLAATSDGKAPGADFDSLAKTLTRYMSVGNPTSGQSR